VQTYLTALEAKLGAVDATAAELKERGADATLETLVAWAELIERPVEVKGTKVLRGLLGGEGAVTWRRAIGMLTPLRKKLEATGEVGSIDRVLERLGSLEGVLPAILREKLERTGGDLEAVTRLFEEAPEIPARWLASEYFGW